MRGSLFHKELINPHKSSKPWPKTLTQDHQNLITSSPRSRVPYFKIFAQGVLLILPSQEGTDRKWFYLCCYLQQRHSVRVCPLCRGMKTLSHSKKRILELQCDDICLLFLLPPVLHLIPRPKTNKWHLMSQTHTQRKLVSVLMIYQMFSCETHFCQKHIFKTICTLYVKLSSVICKIDSFGPHAADLTASYLQQRHSVSLPKNSGQSEREPIYHQSLVQNA